MNQPHPFEVTCACMVNMRKMSSSNVFIGMSIFLRSNQHSELTEKYLTERVCVASYNFSPKTFDTF